MVLDEVLKEQQKTFDNRDMVAIFTEGFLYAMEMQKNGIKVKDINELAENLNEAANEAINEGPYLSAWGSAVASRAIGGVVGDVSNIVFSKQCRDIIRELKNSPKYKKYEKFNKRLQYPVKNTLLALGVKVAIIPNVLFKMEVEFKEEKEARKYLDTLLTDANREYRGIIKHIEVKEEKNYDERTILFLLCRAWK